MRERKRWLSAVIVLGLGVGSAFGGANSGWEIVPAAPSPSPAGSSTAAVVQSRERVNAEPAADRLARLRATVPSGDGGSSVLSKVVATAPTPAPVPAVSVTPAIVVERMRELDIVVPGKSVMQAVAGAPGSGDFNSGGRRNDMLDGVLEAQNDVTPGQPLGQGNGVRASSPSPSPADGVMITGEESSASASPSATRVISPTPSSKAAVTPTPTGTPGSSANPGSFEPALPLSTIEPAASPPAETGEIPRELPGASPSPSPGPSAEGPPPPVPAVQDKVYDLVSGRLPDRGAVRGPREPRVGFYPKAPEPRNAQNLFMEASGGDLPKEEASLW